MADWSPGEVKAAIAALGITMSELSRRAGRHESVVRQALARRLPAVQAIIAQHLGVPPQQIWPSRYRADGTPIRMKKGRKPRSATSIGGAAHGQKGASA